MKSTKIICTLGPTCDTDDAIFALIRGGMNVARLNMSHGTWEQHGTMVKRLHAINEKLRKSGSPEPCIAIMLDTKGAEVRTGVVEKPIVVKKDEKIVFSSKPMPKEKLQVVTVNYDKFGKDVKDAEQIILDNGKIMFELLEIRKDGSVVAKASDDGTIGSRRHVNLPGADLSLPSVTDKDWEDIDHGSAAGADSLALSFVRTAEEVEEVRAFLKKKKRQMMLISKIETRQAVENMEEIIEASDGIMVARGDLGAEVDFVKIPVIQDQLVHLSRQAGKPVIVATHMLESMIDNPMPTRAEVTDIAHAASTRTDATMLSGETASGKHPFKSLDAMARVLGATEDHIASQRRMESATVDSEREARAASAVTLAISSDAAAILVMTRGGHTAREVSRFRPEVPVIAFTEDEWVQRTLQFSYGVTPLCINFDDNDPEKTVANAIKEGKARKCFAKGDTCVLISDALAHNETVSTIQIRKIS